MTLSGLRLSIAGLWCGFWALSSLVVITAPSVRSDEAIGSEQSIGVLLQISGVWLPPLSCFAAFWFPQAEREISRKITIDREKIFGAFVLTTIYMVLVFALLCELMYRAKFPRDASGNLPPGQSLSERVGEIVKMSLLFSPLVLAPVSYFTGRPSGESSSTTETPSPTTPRPTAKPGKKKK